MSDVTIRRAVRADLEGVSALLEEVDALHRDALPWLFRQVDAWHLAFFDPYVSKSDHAMFLAVAPDGSFAGVLNTLVRRPARAPIFQPTVVAEIDGLVVSSRFQRQNIGTRLVQAALDWANLAGASRTELGVFEFNEPARAFWASLGFETLSRRLVRRSEP